MQLLMTDGADQGLVRFTRHNSEAARANALDQRDELRSLCAKVSRRPGQLLSHPRCSVMARFSPIVERCRERHCLTIGIQMHMLEANGLEGGALRLPVSAGQE